MEENEVLVVAMVGAISADDRLADVDTVGSDVGTTTLENDSEGAASVIVVESPNDGSEDEAGAEAMEWVAIDGMLFAEKSPLADAVGTTAVAIADDVDRESVSVDAMSAVASGSSIVAVSVDTATGADLVALCSSQLTPRWPAYMISSSCHTASSIARTRAATVDPWTTPYLAIDSRFCRIDSSQ